MICTLIRVQPR